MKSLALLIVLMLLLVPAVCGIELSVSAGNGGSSGSVNIGLSAEDAASISAKISTKGAALDPVISISGIGNLDQHHQVTDSAGNHAEVHATVHSGNGIYYADRLTPGEGDLGFTAGYVQAEQTLTAGQSEYIACSQSASNRLGAQASSGIEIYQGSLTNYRGVAYADPSFTSALQEFDDAQGKQIILDSLAVYDQFLSQFQLKQQQ